MPDVTNTAPEATDARAFVACLTCCNEGTLNGDWYDPIDAADVTPEDLHRGQPTSHEELWRLDHEGIPFKHEIDPWTATRWAEALERVDEDQRGALTAWVESGDYTTENDLSDIPDTDDFTEKYVGHHDTFLDYARNLVEGLGILQGVSDEVARYWDLDAWARDAAFDYTVIDAVAGVYIFRCC